MRNPKLLSLLRQGCTVIFPSGYFFEGLPNDNYIQVGWIEGDEEYKDGLWILDEFGLDQAIRDEERYSDGDRDDKELALQERKEEME